MGRLTSAIPMVALAFLLGACRTAAPPPRPARVPDPLPAPAAALTEAQRTAIYRALAAAERGDGEAARRELRRLPGDHPAVRLTALEVRFLLGERVGDEVKRLAEEQVDYLPLLGFAAQSLQAEGRYGEALMPARRVLQAGGNGAASRQVRELESLVIGGKAAEARAALQAGDAARAITIASDALSLVPGAVSLLEVLVSAHLAEGNLPAAARLVPSLPDDAEGLALKGKVAVAGQQWDVAAEMFARLPADYPGRCALLADARRRGRLAQAPPYVQKALSSESLTRAELAALVVWEAPAVVEGARGAVSVFEDIVNLSERRDVVTVVRAGVMDGDSVIRRFYPHRRVRSRDLVEVAERLAMVVGRSRPEWCGETRSSGCVEAPGEVVTGSVASALLRQVAAGGDDKCP